MGGRGAASGVSIKGYEYGTEFISLLSADNIKYVKYKHSNAATIPLETMSAGKNRVYVLLDVKNALKSITLYNKEGKLKRQIDLDHSHKGERPHVHSWHDLQRKLSSLTKSDLAYIEKVRRIWKTK